MTIEQEKKLVVYCDRYRIPTAVRLEVFKLARKDFTELNRWILTGAWKSTIIRILKDVNLYDAEVEGMINAECDDAEISNT